MKTKRMFMYKIVEYRKVENKKNLKGYLDIYVPEKKWLIKGCSIFANRGKFWVNMPSRPYKNETGETKYADIIQMHKEDQDVFSTDIIAAMKVYDPMAPKAFVAKKPEPVETQDDMLELPF